MCVPCWLLPRRSPPGRLRIRAAKALAKACELTQTGKDPYGESLDPIVAKAVTLQGSFSHTWRTWENSITLLASGQIPASRIVTHQMSIDDWEEAFTLVEERKALKAVLHPVA